MDSERQEQIHSYLLRVQQAIRDEVRILCGPLRDPISVMDIEDQEGLDLAIQLGKYFQTSEGEPRFKIGVIDPEISESEGIGYFRRGEVVVFEEEERLLTVHRPWSEEVRSRLGSSLRCSTTANVPRSLIRPVGIKNNSFS